MNEPLNTKGWFGLIIILIGLSCIHLSLGQHFHEKIRNDPNYSKMQLPNWGKYVKIQ